MLRRWSNPAPKRGFNRIAPPFDCDGIHPNPRGYFEMGGAVPLELFAP